MTSFTPDATAIYGGPANANNGQVLAALQAMQADMQAMREEMAQGFAEGRGEHRAQFANTRICVKNASYMGNRPPTLELLAPLQKVVSLFLMRFSLFPN